jgi:hypothetical protein
MVPEYLQNGVSLVKATLTIAGAAGMTTSLPKE